MIRLLRDTLKIEYHTFDLNLEKPLKTVLRGVIQEITEDEIQADLISKGYLVTKVSRMMGRNSKPAPLILIEIDREYKSIYNLSNCCGLSISVERLKAKSTVIQCHRCQIFNHTQKNCNADYKCLNSATDTPHTYAQNRVQLLRSAPTAVANYSKCSENPNFNKLPQKPKTVNPWTKINQEHPTTAQAVQPKPTPPTNSHKSPEPQPSNELSIIIGDMFLNFCNTNATQEQKMLFLEQTQKLIHLYTALE